MYTAILHGSKLLVFISIMDVFAKQNVLYTENRKKRDNEFTNKLMTECLNKRKTVLKFPHNSSSSDRKELDWKVKPFFS